VQALRRAQVVADNPVVSTDMRKNLVQMMERNIAIIQCREVPGAAVGAAARAKDDPLGPAVRKNRDAFFKEQLAEMKEVREGVERYARLQNAGLKRDADAELSRLAKQYPDNPSVIFLQDRGNFANAVEDSRTHAQLQNERIALAMRRVDESATPIGGKNGDIEFPDAKKWKELTERRKQTVELTAEEKKIITSLNKAVTVNWSGKPLDEALQELSNTLDLKLFIDEKSITELGIDLQKPVTLQANLVSAKTVLRQVLASQGLTYIVKDQVIQVMDTERAKNMLVTRVYYLGDVIRGTGPFGGLEWGPLANFQQTIANAETIVKSITTSIDPLSWRERGGPCTITFHYPSMSIVVRASAEIHASLGATLAGGK
jgi:hypothetical protein